MKAEHNANKLILDWRLWLVGSLTLGLAPFSPEPHLWGKLKWIAGGAEGMRLMDWFDAIMHGTPWVMLMISLLVAWKKRGKKITRIQGIFITLMVLMALVCMYLNFKV